MRRARWMVPLTEDTVYIDGAETLTEKYVRDMGNVER